MAFEGLIREIRDIGLIPVIKIKDEKKAVPLAKALCEGGLPAAEVTFRTPAAKASIRAISEAFSHMLVGAGTVLTTGQADEAIEAGAKFIVSPGLNPKVVSHCLERGIPILPGCATPSDMEKALELGLTAVKFFPAEANGGLKAVKAMAAPYDALSFMPTGGITEENLCDYLAFPKVIACGGSFMVGEKLIEEERYGEIAALTRKAVLKMLGFTLVHLGINCESEEEAQSTSSALARLQGISNQPLPGAFFPGPFEVLHTPGPGTRGHIAIGVNDLGRGLAFCRRQGFVFEEDGYRYNGEGRLTAAYLKEEIGGFAVHLIQKQGVK